MAQTIKIMISSTRQDLDAYRQRVAKVIRQLNDEKEFVKLIARSMEEETQNGRGETAVAVSKRWVEESDWVVLIVGFNYGTITQEADAKGLSITEWEYRYASELKKEIFVFVAGDPGSPDEYNKSPEEKVDLKNWSIEASDDKRNKLAAFKETLRGRHLNFFKDLGDFGEKLTKTLRKSIDERHLSIPEGTLAELILELQDPIKKCIADVKLLAGYKTIHDLLHEIRNKVIKPLREFRSKWENEKDLTVELVLTLSSKVRNGDIIQTTIREKIKEIPNVSVSFLKTIESVVEADLLKGDHKPDFDAFFKDLDDFASCVQFSFTDTNDLMHEQARLLDNFLDELHSKISQAKFNHHLTEEASKKLGSALGQVKQNKVRLFTVLMSHHKWQKLHDELEQIDSFKDSKLFKTQLTRFYNNRSDTFQEITDEEIQIIKDSYTVDDSTSEDILSCLCRLKTNWFILNPTILSTVSENLEAYEDMRNEFDTVFYRVDKHTLAEVYHARELVVAFEDVLHELNRKKDMAAL